MLPPNRARFESSSDVSFVTRFDFTADQANNLIIGGVLYTPTQSRKIVALNAATGEEIWVWDPAKEHTGNIVVIP